MRRQLGLAIAAAFAVACYSPSKPSLDPVDTFETRTVEGTIDGLRSGGPPRTALVDTVGDLANAPFVRVNQSTTYGAFDRGWTQIRIHRLAIDSPTGTNALASCPAALQIAISITGVAGQRSAVVYDRTGPCQPYALLPTPVVLLSQVDVSAILGAPSFQTYIHVQASLDGAWPQECTEADRADCGAFGPITFRMTVRHDYTIQ